MGEYTLLLFELQAKLQRFMQTLDYVKLKCTENKDILIHCLAVDICHRVG